MAYQYSETRKHILTPEPVIHDMESGKGGDRIMGVLMVLLPPLGALVTTFFRAPLNTHRAGSGENIFRRPACGR